MPEHLRALVFLLVIAGSVFVLAKAPITAVACTPDDFARRRNLWILLTLSAFLAHNFWLFALLAGLVMYLGGRSEPNPYALFLALFLALPEVSKPIPGIVVDALFAVEPLRLLGLLVLLPAYLKLRKQPGTDRFGSLAPDKFLLAYLVLSALLALPHRPFTAVLRDSGFGAFTDIFLPYYVASRGLRSLTRFRDAIGAFTVSALVFSVVLMFEFWYYWLLYASVDDALGVPGGNPYLTRSGLLRGMATGGYAIVAGYTVGVALGLYLYLRTQIPNRWLRHLAMLVLLGGLVGAFSRGPWVGAGAMIAAFVVLGPAPVAGLLKLGAAGLAAIPVLLMTKSGSAIIDHLPWIGTVDEHAVSFRSNLLDVAFVVFMQRPFFGRVDIVNVPDIEALRGSDGVIDLVNTYVYIGLVGGGVSLLLFVGLFASAMLGALRCMRRLPDRRDERYVLGAALLATMVGMLVTIGTVSPIYFILPLYWVLAGLAVGYRRMVEVGEPQAAAVEAPRPGARPSPWLGAHGPRGAAARRGRYPSP